MFEAFIQINMGGMARTVPDQQHIVDLP